MKQFIIKFVSVMIGIGMISPSIQYTPTVHTNSVGVYDVNAYLDISLLNQAQARRGGGMRGGARVGGMRSSGMRRSSFSRNRMSAPRSNRYYGGSFQRSRPAARPSNFKPSRTNKSFTRQTRPTQRPSSRPVGNKPNKPNKPITKPSTRPVQRPNRPGNGHRPITTPGKPSRPGINPPPQHGRPPHGKPPHGGHPPHGRPPHHGHPHHGHHHHHYYPYYGGYWPWFWGSAIVVGAVVSTIPDNDCHDIKIDGKIYKECEGVLFEPVYEGDEVSYKVIKMEKK